MKPVKPALQFSQGRSLPWSGAMLVNCFSEKADGDKREDFAVMLIPGLTVFSNISTDPVRGAIFMADLIYAVVGNALYSVTAAAAATLLGSIAGSGKVRMAANGTEVAIVSETTGYVYSGGAVRLPANLPAVRDVGFLDGYFVWQSASYDQYTWSAINDGLTYNGDVGSVEGSPDALVGMTVDHREILWFGQDSTEPFYNTGDLDAPFQRQGNAFIERGCFDRDSIVKIDGGVQFMGDDRIVYRLNGYTPIRISTHAIEYQLRNVTYAQGFQYTQEGHKFYCLATDNGTFCHDAATGAWHERKSFGQDNWRVGGALTAWGNTYLTDASTGLIYVPSLDVYDENGATISMEIELPTIEAGRERLTMWSFELQAETGVANASAPDPQVSMKYSDDGGRKWSRAMWRSLGATGSYHTRAIWRKLGQFRQRSIRLVITDPCRRFVFGYYADIS